MSLLMKKLKECEPLSNEEASEILTQVFLDCYEDSNSIPIERLELYSNYRSEKLSLQMIIAIASLVAFLVLPLGFISPQFQVSDPYISSRGIAVYAIDVGGALPIKSVRAINGDYVLPVYQRSHRGFEIEPIHGGIVTIRVTLVGGQWIEKEIVLSEYDSKPPTLVDFKVEDERLHLCVEDNLSGIEYGSACIVTDGGQRVMPISFDRKCGVIEFEKSDANGCIYIKDYYGNQLKIKILN